MNKPLKRPTSLRDRANIADLTLTEKRELMKLLKKETNPLDDPEYIQRCIAMRKELEGHCESQGLLLAHVFTASDTPPTTYYNPDNGETYNGRGKHPEWLKGKTKEETEALKKKYKVAVTAEAAE